LREGKDKLKKFEKSEIIIFYSKIYSEMGDHQRAINYLKKKVKEVVNELAYNEAMYTYAMKLGNKEIAIDHLE
jgi:tetratricopeptide (TPR) repeat protein